MPKKTATERYKEHAARAKKLPTIKTMPEMSPEAFFAEKGESNEDKKVEAEHGTKIPRDRTGRPTVMVRPVLLKLEYAFKIGAGVEEAGQGAGG